MLSRVSLASLAVLLLSPTVAWSEDAGSILQKMRAKQIERWQGVENYSVDQSILGQRSTQYFERVASSDPKAAPAFRLVTPAESSQRRSAAAEGRALTADELEASADAHEMLGAGLGEQIENDMKGMGLPPELLRASGMDPRQTMGANAAFLRGAAEAKRSGADEAAADSAEAGLDTDAFAAAARLVGREPVEGRSAFLLRAEKLDRKQQVDGKEFTVQTMSLWIDEEHYVPLRTKTEGVAKDGRKSTPFVIETLEQDYRPVKGSKMLEPYRRVVRMAGVMDAKQQKEMQKAQKELAEFEQQMAAMPEAQRQMIMGRMGSQMEMMRKLAAGGGLDVVTEVHEIRVNSGPPK